MWLQKSCKGWAHFGPTRGLAKSKQVFAEVLQGLGPFWAHQWA